MLLALFVETLHAEEGTHDAALAVAMNGRNIAGAWEVEETLIQGFCGGEPAEAAGSMSHLSWSVAVSGPADVRVAITGATGAPVVAGGFDLSQDGGLLLHLTGNAGGAAGGLITQVDTEITIAPAANGWSGTSRTIRVGTTSKSSMSACFTESRLTITAAAAVAVAPPSTSASAPTAGASAPPSGAGAPGPAAASPAPAPPAAAAAPPGNPGAEWASPSLGTMKWIPPGTFMMGRSLSESPSPHAGNEGEFGQHLVTLTAGFWLMEHEVTEAEWLAVTGAAPAARSCGADCPVVWIGWQAALDFAQKASDRDGVEYRLPTESEWEYAARGGQNKVIGKPSSRTRYEQEATPRSDFRYEYAGSDDPSAAGWHSGNSRGRAHPVCGKIRNGYGLCDMSGNVMERVGNCYTDYPSGGVVDPKPLLFKGCEHILRGGDWGSDPASTRVTERESDDRESKNHSTGLRLVRVAP